MFSWFAPLGRSRMGRPGRPDNSLVLEKILVLSEERRRAIIELLNRDGRVLVPDLSKRFRTSQVTIRKDLEILHEKANCIVVMWALGLLRTELAKIPPCARKSSSTVRRSCTWQQLRPAW